MHVCVVHPCVRVSVHAFVCACVKESLRACETTNVCASLRMCPQARAWGGTRKRECVDASVRTCKCACVWVQGYLPLRCMCTRMHALVFTYENVLAYFPMSARVRMYESVPMCQRTSVRVCVFECVSDRLRVCLRVCMRENAHMSVRVNVWVWMRTKCVRMSVCSWLYTRMCVCLSEWVHEHMRVCVFVCKSLQ